MKKPKKIWSTALTKIPGGNGLLSKRPDRFTKFFWPTYYSKAKDIYLWDLNNKKYTDMSLMGIGTAILGYSNKKIDNFVFKKMRTGVNTTLNSTEEIDLAKELLKIDKFADLVKFSRSGGEAVSIAVRIARAKNKKSKILFSGYHGWHDWYLSANLKNKKNLNNHLLKDLDPIGVPKELKGTNIPIKFNNVDDLKKKIKIKNIAAIVLEPGRFNKINKSFVKEINSLCVRNKICLIVDEITCGWRSNLGGLYKKVGLKPDIVVYGKALGNGYAISCVLGKKKYMSSASKSFISSTSWTEKVGFSASLKTISELKKKNYNHIEKLGKIIKKNWIIYSRKNNIEITVNNYDSIPTFQFNYDKKNEMLYTVFTNFYLKHKILATNSVYLSFSHNKNNIKKYILLLDLAFKEVASYINKKKKLNQKYIRKYNY